VHPEKIITNAAAEEGDRLVLTKPLGIGILATALKGGEIEEEDMMDAINGARELNAGGCRAMQKAGIKACTDITGFGFLGHLFLMLKASQVSAKIYSSKIPIWGKVIEYAEIGLIPGGASQNRDFLKENIAFGPSVSAVTQDILFDPQTSGGLLICVPPEKLDLLLKFLEEEKTVSSAVVGEVIAGPAGMIEVI
jgi:selenide,water dikinase